jgi:hypothetical protein
MLLSTHTFNSLNFCYLQFCCLCCDSAKFKVLNYTVSSTCDRGNFKVKCVELTELQTVLKGADLMYKKECHRLSKLLAELQKNIRETERQTDTAKLIVAFHNFANAPRKHSELIDSCDCSVLHCNIQYRN